MKNILIIILFLTAGCSEDVKPSACKDIEAQYKAMELDIKHYKNGSDVDWAVLADMREELKKLEDIKKQCN